MKQRKREIISLLNLPRAERNVFFQLNQLGKKERKKKFQQACKLVMKSWPMDEQAASSQSVAGKLKS